MQTIARSSFTTVKTEGAILPADLLQRIASGDLDGLQPEAYHLAPNERPNEAISRAWNRCQAVWRSFNEQRRNLPATDTGVSLTRERWLLILFQELGYGRLSYQGRIELADGAVYPISHQWGKTPIHLVSFRQELDRRDPAIKRSPHSLMQEFLNRSDSLWGFVSNGLTLRVLRDNVSLTRAAYLEFDLEMMMVGEIYADFSLLWLVCHQSRVEIGSQPDAPALPSNCWLEKWSQEAAEQGTRALDALRDGVQEAINALGRGFLAHPANGELRRQLNSGELSTQAYYRQLLRLVYRLIFLFVAEDRDLLLLPTSDSLARQRYADHYSVSRLRRLAEGRRGGPHPDLYRTQRRVFGLLRQGYVPLGLPALGSFLFSERSTPALDEADLANTDLLNAIRALAFTIEGQVLRPVDYKNLGSEELGSVYESLLELHPQLNIAAASFELATAAGSERKTTGSYYTPTSLINSLLDSALEPVVKDRLAGKDDPAEAEKALLKIRVVDPAAGSGHFLIAAANRLAVHLARIRTGDYEPSPTARRDAMRDVVRYCIHGVDINEMATELCKVALWMETLDPGKPLSFLEANIQFGNSLIGATPTLLKKGIPDEALNPITGDNEDYCLEWKARNKKERGQVVMDLDTQPWERLGDLATAMAALSQMESNTLAGVQAQEMKYAELVRSTSYLYSQFRADAWCAAFVWPKKPEYQGGYAYPITETVFRKIEHNPRDIAIWMKEEIVHLRDEYQFFHWHLAFPHIFHVPSISEEVDNEQTGWNGGFDVILGNPPWEQVETSDEMSAQERRLVAGSQNFLTNSKYLPLTSTGRKNLYALFSELSVYVNRRKGRVGFIVPTGIVTDQPSENICRLIIKDRLLVSLFDFENTGQRFFKDVHPQYKISLITLVKDQTLHSPTFGFFLDDPNLDTKDGSKIFQLSAEDIENMSPARFSVPIFRNLQDARLAAQIYHSGITLKNLNRNGQTEIESGLILNFDMRSSAIKVDLSTVEDESEQRVEEFLKVYEGEYFFRFDHRYSSARRDQVVKSTETQKKSPNWTITTATLVNSDNAVSRWEEMGVSLSWFLGLRRQTNVRNVCTSIAAILPPSLAEGSVSCFYGSNLSAEVALILCSNLNTFTFDYIARMRMSGRNFSKTIYQQVPLIQELENILRSIPIDAVRNQLLKQIKPRALELIYTAWDLRQFANACGYLGSPFIWSQERRFLLMCELDGVYFHLYGIKRPDVEYMLDTFDALQRKDEDVYGEYRTKRVILEIYDEMAEAIRTNRPYQTCLDPPPADLHVAHPWDPAFGEPPAPGQEWIRETHDSRSLTAGEKLAPSVIVEKREAYSAKGSSTFQQTVEAEPLVLSHPEPKTKKPKLSKPVQVAQGTFLEVMPAPAGPRSVRLKRAMALRSDPSPVATRELVTFMTDEDSNIRWLAGSSLMHRADADTVAAIAALLNRAEPERVELMRAEALRILDLIAETAAEEVVRQAASEALSTFRS